MENSKTNIRKIEKNSMSDIFALNVDVLKWICFGGFIGLSSFVVDSNKFKEASMCANFLDYFWIFTILKMNLLD
jgi:hypothetical protein